MNRIFQPEIKRAISWIFETQNLQNYGWSWVRDISPNVQNTAEVIHAVSKFTDLITPNQKKLINKAVDYWLLYPIRHAVIIMDWVWIGIALAEYKNNIKVFDNDNKAYEIDAAIVLCITEILSHQNKDGGWADNKGEISSTTRTSLCLYLLNIVGLDNADIKHAIEDAMVWLLKMQNKDGGWGNIDINDVYKDSFEKVEISPIIVGLQYLSNSTATGYALLAISEYDKFHYMKNITKGIAYLEALILEKGRFEIFYEIGIRNEIMFTYRHFGATWAGIGLLNCEHNKVSDKIIIINTKHIANIQDSVSGGFKCSEHSDVYTWSTCNALCYLSYITNGIKQIASDEYYDHMMDYIKVSSSRKQTTKRSYIFKISLFITIVIMFCLVMYLLHK